MSTQRDTATRRPPPPPPDPKIVLSGNTGVTTLMFISDDVIVTGHAGGKIQEWSLHIQRSKQTWDGHSDSVLWLTSLHDHLFSQGRDGLVKLWIKLDQDDKPSQWIFHCQVSSSPLIFCNSAIVYNSSSHYLTTPSDQTSNIKCYKINKASSSNNGKSAVSLTLSISNSHINTLKPMCVKEYGMCMKMRDINLIETSEGHDELIGYLLVGYESGKIALWDIDKNQMLHSLQIHDDTIMCMDIWTNSKTGQVSGLSGSVDNVIKSWTISNYTLVLLEQNVATTNKGFNDITIRDDGKIFATGGWDCIGRVFGTKKLCPLAVLTYHKESVNCVKFSSSNTLALASKDGYITLWDIYKDK